ncbi:MAG: tripartite tricarboxylate transporter substrate binding protein [Alphaproteobacteria bacterium]|nr:tripartite tricarboxylate transporter substrate binding protein [Alphaproteobacteria bacterium]
MTLSRRAALGGALMTPTVAWGQAFPSKPLTMVVPFPAGGPADLFGRHLAKGIGERLGQPAIVENKAGVAGVTGMDFVAKAGADAHVMGLMSSSAGAIMPTLMPRMPYDPVKDLAPLTLVVKVQEVLAVDARLGIVDLKALIARAKAQPGRLTYGSAGTGGITHLAGELLKRETGVDILHVPYRGAAPAVQDLLAGTVNMAILDVPVLLAHIRSGALKALAITSQSRAGLLPGVPSMAELGLANVNSDNWYALVSPGGASQAARQRIQTAAVETLKMPETIDAFAKVGGVAVGGTPAELAAFLRGETAKWAAVIKAANVKLE